MNKIIKFRNKSLWVRYIFITVIIAIIAGFFLSEVLPDNIINATELTNKNPVKIIGNLSGNAIVTDGDTIKIDGTRIRLHGIDAPEIKQPCWKNNIKYQCGQKAKTYLQQLINNQIVICKTINKDRYGREIAKCFNYKNIEINAMMVLSGNAIAYLHYSQDYAAYQTKAQSKKIGVWAGRFMESYKYRKMQKASF